MKIKRKYRTLFFDLNTSNNGLLGFTLHNRYNLTPSDVVDFIILFQSCGYITCDNEYRIKLTELGRKAIDEIKIETQDSGYEKGSDYFDDIQSDSKLKINEPYIPDCNFLQVGKSKTV